MLKSRNVEVKVHAQQQWHRLEEWAVIPEKTRGSLIKSYANSSLSVVSQKGEANNISCRNTSSSGASWQIFLLLQIQRDLSYQRHSSLRTRPALTWPAFIPCWYKQVLQIKAISLRPVKDRRSSLTVHTEWRESRGLLVKLPFSTSQSYNAGTFNALD